MTEHVPQPSTVARRGSVMAVGAAVSRVTGFVRTAVLGAVLGAAAVGNAYAAATMLPGIVYEVLLGGVLTGVLVLLLVRAREGDGDQGEAYAQRLVTAAVLVFAVAAVLATASTPLLVEVLSSGATTEANRDLLAALAYMVLPGILFYGAGRRAGGRAQLP